MAGNPADFSLWMVKISIERNMSKGHHLHTALSGTSHGASRLTPYKHAHGRALGGALKDGPQNWAKMETFWKLSQKNNNQTLSTC